MHDRVLTVTVTVHTAPAIVDVFDLYRVNFTAVDKLGRRVHGICIVLGKTEICSGDVKLVRADLYRLSVPRLVRGFKLAEIKIPSDVANGSSIAVKRSLTLIAVYKVPARIRLNISSTVTPRGLLVTGTVRVSDYAGVPVVNRSLIVKVLTESGTTVQTLSLMTDRSGRANFTLLLRLGTYTVEVVLPEDDIYSESSATAIVTVTKPVAAASGLMLTLVLTVVALAAAAVVVACVLKQRRCLSKELVFT